jgi:hypothetical protein
VDRVRELRQQEWAVLAIAQLDMAGTQWQLTCERPQIAQPQGGDDTAAAP